MYEPGIYTSVPLSYDQVINFSFFLPPPLSLNTGDKDGDRWRRYELYSFIVPFHLSRIFIENFPPFSTHLLLSSPAAKFRAQWTCHESRVGACMRGGRSHHETEWDVMNYSIQFPPELDARNSSPCEVII